MTCERDRIQENANEYIVKNCPAIYGIDDGFLCSDNNNEDEKYCADCTDCVIKQVIDRCNKDKIHKYDYKVSKDVLNMFDIAEVK